MEGVTTSMLPEGFSTPQLFTFLRFYLFTFLPVVAASQ